METPETPAGPGAFAPRKPFEVRIRRGVIIAMLGTTLVGVSSTFVQLAARILPMFSVMETGDVYEVYTYLRPIYFALEVAFVVGVFIFTTWPGPARRFATTARILAVVSVVVLLVRSATFVYLIDFVGYRFIGLIMLFTTAVTATSLGLALYFCALIVRDRGDVEGSRMLVWFTAIVTMFSVGRAFLLCIIGFLGSSSEVLNIAFDILEVFALGLIMTIFLKTWRALS